MNILYVSSDNFYNCALNIFNPNQSADNLVYFHYCFEDLVKRHHGSIDIFPGNKKINYEYVIFNDYPLPGTKQEKFLHQCLSEEKSKLILYLMETPVVRKDYWRLYELDSLSVFDTVYTWNRDLCNDKNIRMTNFTSNIKQCFEVGPRPGMLTCIAANKKIKHQNACYYLRRKGIRALAQADIPFDLYGHGWDKLKVPSGIIGSVGNRLLRIGPRVSGSNYAWRGAVEEKGKILSKYNFNLVIENATNYKGYITEKILHSFVYGCIPIYYGSNTARHIFKDCALYLDDFKNWDMLVSFLKNISDEEIIHMQKSISDFLVSKEIRQFDAKYEAERIFRDLGGIIE